MNLKKIVLAVLCLLLTAVIVMTGVLISRVTQMLGGNGEQTVLDGTQTAGKPDSNTGNAVPETEQQPQTESQPPIQETTLPTEPGHTHTLSLLKSVSAGCENAGYDLLICTVCGREIIDNIVDAYGHNFGPGETTDPTCTEYGCTKAFCYTCGQTVERNIRDALGHDYQLLESVSPGCAQDGYDKSQCSRCGEILVENEVPAFGHAEELVEVVTEPGCTADGLLRLHCTVCDMYYDRNVPAFGHSFEDPWMLDAQGAYCDCEMCCENVFVAYSQMEITQEEEQIGDDGCIVHIVIVGTPEIPDIRTFIIRDYLMNGTVGWRLSLGQGLVVFYTDTDETPHQELIPFSGTGCLDIPVGG